MTRVAALLMLAIGATVGRAQAPSGNPFAPSSAPSPRQQSAPQANRIPFTLYRLSGNRALWPQGLNDDGVKTFLRWGNDQAIPAVFGSDGPGQEETINGYMRDGVFTIDRVYGRLIFRIDKVEAVATRVTAKRKNRD